jgi:DNA repair exonuclease SbcCD ATPase subunit
MNPLLKNQFDSVRKQLDSLKTVLQENQDELQKQHTEKEDLLQEKWRNRKHLTTLERIEGDYDSVEAENDRYRQERTEIREDLNQIVSLTKALHRIQKP